MSSIVTFLIVLAIYFAPTTVALARGRDPVGPTIVVNVFLGWTLVGWVVALAMALGKGTKQVPV